MSLPKKVAKNCFSSHHVLSESSQLKGIAWAIILEGSYKGKLKKIEGLVIQSSKSHLKFYFFI